jgi:nitrogen fixation/metabolism regulation signal transduction histidine kinase
MLARSAMRVSREVRRFLDAVSYNDTSASFMTLNRDPAFAELGVAMAGVIDRLRAGQLAREEQTLYLQTLLAHVPVGLLVMDEQGGLELLNPAARRLFETPCATLSQCGRHGEAFQAGLEGLTPGATAVLPMKRNAGVLQLKAAATGIGQGGARRLLISLQNIENELTAAELAAWQTVIRVMAHEVTNSLTPISSLAETARDCVTEALEQTGDDDARHASLADAKEALETLSQRSEGLLFFVQNHRRLTRRLEVRVAATPLHRIFNRLERLFAAELDAGRIEVIIRVDPANLELVADEELLDQALINLMRNAIEALRDQESGQITLSAYRDPNSRIVIAIADNGPGIPEERREKVFIPFFSTKRRGSGVGLSLVRQIAAAHGATAHIFDGPNGGAEVRLRF